MRDLYRVDTSIRDTTRMGIRETKAKEFTLPKKRGSADPNQIFASAVSVAARRRLRAS